MDTRKYYENEVDKILNQYQQDDFSIISYYQSKIVELVMQIDNESYLREIYNLADGLATY